MEFTPGPWELDDMGDSIDVITNSDHPHVPIWIAKGISGYDGDIENCQLIAAAPEMYAALKYVVEYHRENDSGEGELFGLDFVTTCINALRKANADYHL